MKKLVLSSLGLLSALALSEPAQAQDGYWSGYLGKKAYQVGGPGFIIGQTSAGNNNFYIEYWTIGGGWKVLAQGAGRSLTTAYDGTVWATTYQDGIWKLKNGAWWQISSTNCEGGTISFSKTLRNNNIAAGRTLYAISTDGAAAGGTNIRRFNAGSNCWEIMPGNGKGVEIAMVDSSSDVPWVRTAVNGLWYFTGTGWNQLDGAVTTAIGRGSAVGSDGTLLFSCFINPESCSWVSSWDLGVISATFDAGFVIGPDDYVVGWQTQ